MKTLKLNSEFEKDFLIKIIARAAGEMYLRLEALGNEAIRIQTEDPGRAAEMNQRIVNDTELTSKHMGVVGDFLDRLGVNPKDKKSLSETGKKDILIRAGYFARQAVKPGEN